MNQIFVMSQTQPQLSAILVCHRHFNDVRQTIRHLSRQTIASDLELVLVVQPRSRGSLDPEAWSGIGHVQIVELPSIGLLAEAWEAGVRHCQARYFALCEDHSFPAPNWAELLVAALDQGYTAVCPAIASPNGSLIGQANYLNCFGSFFQPAGTHVRPILAGHNSAYRRDVLIQRFPDLCAALHSESSTHLLLTAEGHRLAVVGGTSTSHVNISRLWPYLRQAFFGGQIFGANRAATWPLTRKLIASVGAPLVPWVRLWRNYRLLNTAQKRRDVRWPSVVPVMFVGLVLHALGEVWGYWRGEQDAPRHYWLFEADRRSCVRPEDWALWEVDPQFDSVPVTR